MTPDERQMLTGLFERIKAAANGPRDAQAEAFIADNVRALPVAPYLLAQTVLVQEQALGAASQRLQELEDKIHALEQQQGSGTFLGGLGKSMFGGANPPLPSPAAAPRPSAPQASPGGPWGSQAAAGPWGQPQQIPPAGPWAQPSAGGSFLSGALTTAAGVAGGMLLADSMRNLFMGGHNATLANMAGPGLLGGGATPAGETIINNYYGSDSDAQRAQDIQQDQDQDQDDAQDAADDYGSGSDFDTGGGFGGDFGGGDSFDV